MWLTLESHSITALANMIWIFLNGLREVLAGHKIPDARDALARVDHALANVENQQRIILAATGNFSSIGQLH